MSQYKGLGDPDIEELVPRTPIVINGRSFNPSKCIHAANQDDPHECAHDWRIYWGNQTRAQ